MGGSVKFGLLGPLEVTDGGRPVPIPSAKLRVLLACLLLRAGELVTVDELAEAIWGDDALPAHPRRAVQTYVTRLRQLLGGDGLIQSRNEGYVIAVAAGEVDVDRLDLLLARARDAADAGDRRREAAVLRQALALWRGEPLADVPSETLHRDAVARLTEQRLDALCRRIEADLALGRHPELISELRTLTDRHPLREQLWAQLMTALYRCGRQADALQAYHSAAGLLADELGVDPGAELRALHQAILSNDPALMVLPPAARRETSAKQFQLPLDVGDFVGRADLVRQIEQLLADDLRVPVVALSGPPGVGKSALAVHAAHRLAMHFPDGQLYVNLHGATAGLQPLRPLEVLGRFLRALGTGLAAVPAELEEASAAFRSQMAGRRVLLLLDNAADAAQLVPLLPASSGCGVLVTSRRVLARLEGAANLRLDALAPGEAVELLGRVAGQERVASEPEAAAELAGWCGRLPLALRIAGARLAARPAWPVSALAERLADAQGRLDELELAEVGVRASFAVSHQQLCDSADALDRMAAEAFGLLGILDGAEVGVPVAARLLDVGVDAADRTLERLVDAQLLETPAPGRYRLHDLLRLYGRELACQQHPEPVRAAALARPLEFYVATAWHTMALLRPADHRLPLVDARWDKDGLQFADDQAALGWLEAERANLLAAVRQSAAAPGVPDELAIQLAQALAGFLWVRNYWDDWAQVNQTALEVACRVGDRAAQAHAYNDLGLAHWRQGRYDQALACHQQSLTIRRELGDRRGEGASLNNLAQVYEWQGRYDQAVAHLQAGMAIWRELGNRHGLANSLGNLGNNYKRLGRYDEALACQQESLAAYRELAWRAGLARGLRNLGGAYERLGRHDEALACLHEGLSIYDELGDRDGQAFCLNDLGIVHQRQGNYALALACQRKSLAIRRELGDAHCEAESLRELGVTLRAFGHLDEARAHWLEALATFERLESTDADQVRAVLAELPTRRATVAGRRRWKTAMPGC
jgi:DNA-binding SARP family transcriptional activator/DNA polymerase III delta prime subunit